MIRVCITGAGSYIGTHIGLHLAQMPEQFEVAEMDVSQPWQPDGLRGFDAVIHVAGIAHQKETDENRALYTTVNRDLALEVAKAAKANGVKQFVFFSSMSVYGITVGAISADTQPAPNTAYGISKWEAEQGLDALADESFRVAVLRPPMIYGQGCRGNYPRLSALARSLPVFPKVDNQRSMLYIGTLCQFVQKLLESGKDGLYFPQNREYVNTTELVKEVARCHNKRLLALSGFARLLKLLEGKVSLVSKVFGSLTYDQKMSDAFRPVDELDFVDTIKQTEGV
ncbi:MAG: NAD-dependent epimerase/dehydratase family protein [Clostridia bacterium]|nr:NAD-dependent epimerase/dehydratase family protein [Clostridia bacterium]